MRTIRLAVTTFSLASVLVVSGPVAAQELHGQVAAQPSSPFSGSWYGWQVLLSGAGLPLTWLTTRLADMDLTEADRPVGQVFLFGSILSPIAPAVVHAAHGYGWRAVGSLALDVGLPALIGTALGAATDEGGSDHDEYDDEYGDGGGSWFRCDFACGFVAGFALSAPLGTIVDAIFLSWEQPAVEWDGSVSVQPALVLADDGMTLGVSGSF